MTWVKSVAVTRLDCPLSAPVRWQQNRRAPEMVGAEVAGKSAECMLVPEAPAGGMDVIPVDPATAQLH